jgi:hypothetical protein
MLSRKMVSHVTVAATILILSGCSTAGINNIDPNGNNTNNVNNNTGSGLTFSKVSEDKKSQYNNLITQNAVAVNESATAPSAGATAPASAPMVAVAGDAKMASGISAYPMSYFPQPGIFEEYVVTDFEEAKTAGFSGTYLNALTTVVKPVINKLGTDIRMVNSYGSSDDSGVNKSNTTEPANNPGYYNPYQWQFTFVSSSKKEVYNIFISSTETLVLRQKWGIKDLDPNEIKIDSSDAIAKIKTAIANKKFTAPDDQQQYYSPEAEILYELPKDASWYLYLEKDKGKLVWNINFNYYNNNGPIAYAKDAGGTTGSSGSGTARAVAAVAPDTPVATTIAVGEPNPGTPVMMPPSPEYWYNGGYARVDAATGDILSLVRPTRYKNVNVYPPCCKTDPVPMPAPAVDPTVEKQ